MLRILPALPADWSSGEFRGMLTRAGVPTSANWDMGEKTIELSMSAVRDAVFDLKFPSELAEITASRPDAVTASMHGERFRAVKLAKGEELKLSVRLK